MKRFFFPLLIISALLAGCSSSDNDTDNPTPPGPKPEQPGEPTITLSSHSIELSNGQAIKQVTVNSSEGWTSEISEEASKWISIIPASSATGGKKTVSVVIKENTEYESREGDVTFSLSDGTSETLTVTQMHTNFMEVDEDVVSVGADGGTINIPISYNVSGYNVAIAYATESSEWIHQLDTRTITNEEIVFTVDANDSGLWRKATITVSDKSGKFAHEVAVSQSGDNMEDGQYFKLQQATVGTGVNLIFMGDGYTEEEVNTTGQYQSEIEEAVEDFFSIYPYKEFREYFNVWMVVGISQESGVTTGSTKKDTRFRANITGNGTEINCHYNTVTEYATSIPGLPEKDELTVILILNSPKYAGTCMMTAAGYSISMCPRIANGKPGANARAVITHEAGGHGFAKLCDEYRYYKQTFPEENAMSIKYWQQNFRAQMNVDFTDDLTEIVWKDFLKYDKYKAPAAFSPVGAYEGSCMYEYDIWRAEENSCMNNNIDYFNAPSRWEIVRRIMDLSGESSKYASEDKVFEWFVANDNPPQPTHTRSAASMYDFVPLGRPILVE